MKKGLTPVITLKYGLSYKGLILIHTIEEGRTPLVYYNIYCIIDIM